MNWTELNEDIHQYPIRPEANNIEQPPENLAVNIVQENNRPDVSEYIQRLNVNKDLIEVEPNFVNTYFNKIYCLSLSKRIHKWESTELRLNQQNVNATRFEAIDGDIFNDDGSISKNELGCLCSHLEIIKDAKRNNYSKILILEDDVHLSKDFQSRICLIKNLPWKLLYLGGSQYNWSDIDTDNDFYFSSDTLGTFAYAVDSSIFDDLIETFSQKNSQVDKMLSDIQKKYHGECFTMYPNIVIPDVSTSDIRSPRDIQTHSSLMKWNLENFPAFDSTTKKVLLIPDARKWAFDNIARSIIKYNPYPDKIYYDIVYCRDIYLQKNSVDTTLWDLVYLMFEGERIIPTAKNIVRGCYSAFWLENPQFTPEFMGKYFSQCGGAIYANPQLKKKFEPYLPKNFHTEIIYDSSDENIFYPIKHKKNQDFTVLYVGNTKRPVKNFKKIEEICKRANVKLQVCKNVKYQDLVHEYNKADLLINFSDFEGGPQTFVEASMCEVPTLIRKGNELAKIIPCFTGKTEDDFVKILSNLKNNRKLCEEKGQEAYKVAIEKLTYKKTAAKFADYFMSFGKKDLRKDLTVFVINAGENPNYEDCISALQNQNCIFQIKYINNVAPMSKAFQRMITECKTPYYIQVDGDMILNPTAVETIYDTLVSSDKNTSIVAYMLKDVHLNFNIYGVKGYKHSVLSQYPYNLKIISCEVEQMKRMEKDGYKTDMIEAVLGQHSPKWTPELIYERYFDLMEKWKVYKYHWMGKLPHKLLQIYKQDPSDINFYALAGSMYSLSSSTPIRDREKDFTIQEDNFKIIKSLYLLEQS